MKNIILKLIRLYQKTISPNHGFFCMGAMRCRFFPSCSEYAYQAIEKFGVARGILKGGLRILRCSPWSQGGVDMI